jgi:hypothetical protein
MESDIGSSGYPYRRYPYYGVVNAVTFPVVRNKDLFIFENQAWFIHRCGDGGVVGDIIRAEPVYRPQFYLITGSGNDILYNTRYRYDLGFRERVLQDLQAEMVIGMEVGHVNVGQVLTHRDNISDHPVGIAQKLRCVYQYGVPLSINQCGVAVKTQVTVEKNSKL